MKHADVFLAVENAFFCEARVYHKFDSVNCDGSFCEIRCENNSSLYVVLDWLEDFLYQFLGHSAVQTEAFKSLESLVLQLPITKFDVILRREENQNSFSHIRLLQVNSLHELQYFGDVICGNVSFQIFYFFGEL